MSGALAGSNPTMGGNYSKRANRGYNPKYEQSSFISFSTLCGQKRKQVETSHSSHNQVLIAISSKSSIQDKDSSDLDPTHNSIAHQASASADLLKTQSLTESLLATTIDDHHMLVGHSNDKMDDDLDNELCEDDEDEEEFSDYEG